MNHRIRVPEIRVIHGEEQLGVMNTQDAMRLAEEKGLDLVEISPQARPPVCKIMDYGKYKYEQSKKKQAARKHQSTVEVKEIKFRPKTETHDMDFKIKHTRRFLEEGNKVRLVVTFRGREIVHPETGVAVLNKVVQATQDLSQVEARPNMEGRRMVMVLGPRAGVVRRAPRPEAAAAAPKAAAPRPAPAGDGAGTPEGGDDSSPAASDRAESGGPAQPS